MIVPEQSVAIFEVIVPVQNITLRSEVLGSGYLAFCI